MKKNRKELKSEKGDIVLESLIVYTITIFLLFFILSIFTVLFQRWNIQTIANETAARIAQTYKLTEADESTGYVTEAQISDVREYRYIWNDTELQNSATAKIKEYADWRLSRTTFTKDVVEPQFMVEVKHDSLARRHIEVSIAGEYAVPFGEILSYFGFESTTKYKVTAYAECLDLIDYVNTVNFVENQISLGEFNSKFIKMINKILGLFDHIFGGGT